MWTNQESDPPRGGWCFLNSSHLLLHEAKMTSMCQRHRTGSENWTLGHATNSVLRTSSHHIDRTFPYRTNDRTTAPHRACSSPN